MIRIVIWLQAWLIGLIALVAASDRVIAADKPIATLQGHTQKITSLAYSPDGKTLASGSIDKTIKLWDAASSESKERTLSGHADQINCVAFSPDGKLLASGSTDKTIRLWDVKTEKEVAVLRGHEVSVLTLAFSPDGKLLASAGLNLRESYSSEIKLWDFDSETATAKEKTSLPEGLSVRSVAFSPDSKTLAYGSGGLRLWDVANGKELPSPKRATFGNVVSVAYSLDGKTLAYASGYTNRPVNIVLLDLATKKERTEIGESLMGLGQVIYHADGKIAAAWGEGYNKTTQLKLWDVAAHKQHSIITTNGVTAAAFRPNSKQIAIAENDSTIKIWEIGEGQ